MRSEFINPYVESFVLKTARRLLLPLVLGASVFICGAIAPAQADTYATYNFAFLGSDSTTTASGSITIDTTAPDSTNSLNTPPGYDITAITGTFGGFAITLVSSATCAVSAPCDTLDPTPDNILYLPGSPTFLDLGGLIFSDTNGDLVNLYSDGTDYYALVCSDCAAFADAYFVDGSFSVSPLPASLPLLGSVLGGSFFVAKWRRRHRYRSAAA
ncbi:MAG: hypothetical protein ACLP0B_14035 [Steroidobacteraceae bacterium]